MNVAHIESVVRDARDTPHAQGGVRILCRFIGELFVCVFLFMLVAYTRASVCVCVCVCVRVYDAA